MGGLVFKIYGTVAYDDGSCDPIELTYDGSIHGFGQEGFRNLHRDMSVVYTAFLNLLSMAYSCAAPAVDKTVSEFNLTVSGLYAADDGSTEPFVYSISYGATGNSIVLISKDEFVSSVHSILAYDHDHDKIMKQMISTLSGAPSVYV